LERLGTAVHPTPQWFLRQQPEPALHHIEPGRAGRREVEMEAWSLEEPALDQGRFVRPLVVEDQMHLQLSRDIRLNRVE
jgi:hypothetical protein